MQFIVLRMFVHINSIFAASLYGRQATLNPPFIQYFQESDTLIKIFLQEQKNGKTNSFAFIYPLSTSPLIVVVAVYPLRCSSLSLLVECS